MWPRVSIPVGLHDFVFMGMQINRNLSYVLACRKNQGVCVCVNYLLTMYLNILEEIRCLNNALGDNPSLPLGLLLSPVTPFSCRLLPTVAQHFKPSILNSSCTRKRDCFPRNSNKNARIESHWFCATWLRFNQAPWPVGRKLFDQAWVKCPSLETELDQPYWSRARTRVRTRARTPALRWARHLGHFV